MPLNEASVQPPETRIYSRQRSPSTIPDFLHNDHSRILKNTYSTIHIIRHQSTILTTAAMQFTTSQPITFLLIALITLLQLTSAGTMRNRPRADIPQAPVAEHIDTNFPMSFAETVTHNMDYRSVSCSSGVKVACNGAASTSCSGANCKVCCNDCCRYINGTYSSTMC